jgi:hypothetical protein
MSSGLSIYLNDHLMGASAGVDLFRRAARQQAQTSRGAALRRLAEEVEADRLELVEIMKALGLPRRRYKILAGHLLEPIGRGKLNGSLLHRSRLSDLVELELLSVAVTGKRSGWNALAQIADQRPELDKAKLDELIERASDQVTRLEAMRREVARSALS